MLVHNEDVQRRRPLTVELHSLEQVPNVNVCVRKGVALARPVAATKLVLVTRVA
jgi:hypothetical protein